MLSALYAIASLSVCLSVCHTGGSVEAVEDSIMQFSPYGSPILWYLRGKFHPKILTGSPDRGVKQRRGGKTSHFLALNVNISKMVGDTAIVTMNE